MSDHVRSMQHQENQTQQRERRKVKLILMMMKKERKEQRGGNKERKEDRSEWTEAAMARGRREKKGEAFQMWKYKMMGQKLE